jgi:hypothetical protein
LRKEIVMKKIAIAMVAIGLAACGNDDNNGNNNSTPDARVQTPTPDAMEPLPSNVVELRGDLTGDQHWTADKEYYLRESTFIVGGTLTIDPGTVIKGDPGAAVVITRTGKISAVGTAENPIVFTASTKAGFRKAGDWGGLVLLGNAQINLPAPPSTATDEKIEGFPDSAGERVRYGSNTDAMNAHDCGELKYVRIEFAGFEIAENNEINGLTLGGCGSATKIEYVQVHRGADDGVEIFGGTVNLKHVLITVPDDDGLDTDFGWTGKAQFVVIQQGANRGNNGFEWDNRNNVNDATPRTNPTLYNFTLIGSNANFGASANAEGQRAMVLRRGTAGTMHNFIIQTFNDYPIDVDSSVSGGFFKNVTVPAVGTTLRVTHSLLYNDPGDNSSTNRKPFPRDADPSATLTISRFWPLNVPTAVTAAKDPTAGDGMAADTDVDVGGGNSVRRSAEETIFRTPEYGNQLVNPLLTTPLYAVPHAPDFRPTAASPALAAQGYVAEPIPDGDTFFQAVDYAGAMGPAESDDWTKPWAQYPQN